jgi:hypothetical protein
LRQSAVGSEASRKDPLPIGILVLETLDLGPQLIHQLPLEEQVGLNDHRIAGLILKTGSGGLL